ncbi:MAG TPA: glycosyltransferase family 39 protein [Acidobacteriaceae bacterium]|nr:glycosyltransferase family 39 protein [Acidobacteriaceae bacterium]
MAESQLASGIEPQSLRINQQRSWTCLVLYLLALLASISTWFLAIRAPLWPDETGAYWMISDGVSKIWPHKSILFPAYDYILWSWTKLFGTSEVALRSLSILATLAAAWLLYLAARKLFDRELALIAVIIFCLDPITIFEAVDVRPYTFAVLAVCLAIYLLLRLRNSRSLLLAAAFGLAAALILYFHLLFGTILPALLIAFFILKASDRKSLRRQLAVALATFTVASLPLIPIVLYLFRTSSARVYEKAPKLITLLATLAPRWMPIVLIAVALLALVIAALRTRTAAPKKPPSTRDFQTILIAALLGLVPVLILYGVSVGTSIHCFAFRHRLEAIPGIALCWTWLVARFRPPMLRRTFVFFLVALTVFSYWSSPAARKHGFSWKQALQVTEQNAAPHNAPVLICSTSVETNYFPIPLRTAKTSRYYAQLSYYKLTVPVVPLPRKLDAQSIQIATPFLQQAAKNRQRFFADGYIPSYSTLQWLTAHAAPNFNVRQLGNFDGYKVLEFTPRANTSPPAAPQKP